MSVIPSSVMSGDLNAQPLTLRSSAKTCNLTQGDLVGSPLNVTELSGAVSSWNAASPRCAARRRASLSHSGDSARQTEVKWLDHR
jgi:hypothetical protein